MEQKNNFEEFKNPRYKYQSDYFKSSKTLAFWSFIIGTIVLITFYFSKSHSFILFGLLYVCLAALISGGLLIKLIFNWFTDRYHRKDIFKAILILLCNIPIVLIYIKIYFWILGNISNE